MIGENEHFARGGMIFSCVRARMIFFDPRGLLGAVESSIAVEDAVLEKVQGATP